MKSNPKSNTFDPKIIQAYAKPTLHHENYINRETFLNFGLEKLNQENLERILQVRELLKLLMKHPRRLPLKMTKDSLRLELHPQNFIQVKFKYLLLSKDACYIFFKDL